ncbi:hypothetical protein Tco_0193734 [Tanacetum coccineum]
MVPNIYCCGAGTAVDTEANEKIMRKNPDIGIGVEYQKASLASADVSALDKPHFQLLRRFIHYANHEDACTVFILWFFGFERRGRKKKKSNNNVSFGPGSDSGSTPLVDATGTIHIGTGLINNLRNGRNGDGDSENVGQTCPNSGLNPPLPSQETTSVGNAPSKSSYANVTGKPSGKKVNIHTLFTSGGNGIDVVVLMESIRAISERSSYAKAMIELRADVELKDNIIAAMPKITKECYYTCAGETKNMKKTSQTPKASTDNTSVNKKKNVEPTKEVSKSNPFEVLTSVKIDVDLGTNGGTSNLASQATNSSGSSFWNVDASSPSTTPVIKKINKIEKLIIEGKVTLVDDHGKPLEKVVSLGYYDSEDEVASVDNNMAKFLAKEDGYGKQTLLEKWTKSYENGDYGFDPYNDDMYESHDIPEKLQAICDNLDITVSGRRKK